MTQRASLVVLAVKNPPAKNGFDNQNYLFLIYILSFLVRKIEFSVHSILKVFLVSAFYYHGSDV